MKLEEIITNVMNLALIHVKISLWSSSICFLILIIIKFLPHKLSKYIFPLSECFFFLFSFWYSFLTQMHFDQIIFVYTKSFKNLMRHLYSCNCSHTIIYCNYKQMIKYVYIYIYMVWSNVSHITYVCLWMYIYNMYV